MDYRREIDGLRGLAVVPVILFHAGFETFSGGCPGGSCKALDNNGSPLYKDGNHMRPDYVKYVVGPQLMKNLR